MAQRDAQSRLLVPSGEWRSLREQGRAEAGPQARPKVAKVKAMANKLAFGRQKVYCHARRILVQSVVEAGKADGDGDGDGDGWKRVEVGRATDAGYKQAGRWLRSRDLNE